MKELNKPSYKELCATIGFQQWKYYSAQQM
jgi:hypothetical protein